MKSSLAVRNNATVRDNATVGATRWLSYIARVILPAGLFAIALIGTLATPAHAQTAQSKIATDLQLVQARC